MACFFKSFLRFGVISGLAAAGALTLAGPERASALFTQAKTSVLSAIDANIEDPVALRAQLKQLEAEYPERIQQVSSDLAELNRNIAELSDERDVAHGVVALAERDLGVLEPMLAQATAASHSSSSPFQTIRFDNRTISVKQALTRADQLEQMKVSYAMQALDAERDLTYLVQQADRLEKLHVELKAERSQFQTQISQLERQVDAIARNDRLIELIEERNETIEECSRYEVKSLDQLTSRLSELRARQEAELEFLSTNDDMADYEEIARMQVRMQREGLEPAAELNAVDGAAFESMSSRALRER